jgi:hypothetical protein
MGSRADWSGTVGLGDSNVLGEKCFAPNQLSEVRDRSTASFLTALGKCGIDIVLEIGP